MPHSLLRGRRDASASWLRGSRAFELGEPLRQPGLLLTTFVTLKMHGLGVDRWCSGEPSFIQASEDLQLRLWDARAMQVRTTRVPLYPSNTRAQRQCDSGMMTQSTQHAYPLPLFMDACLRR